MTTEKHNWCAQMVRNSRSMGRKDTETIEPLYFIPLERLHHFKYQQQKIKRREQISISSVCFFCFFFSRPSPGSISH